MSNGYQSAAFGPQSDDAGMEDRLRKLVESIAQMARDSNIELVAHRPESWSYYRTLPVLRKQEILKGCETYHEICVSTIQEGRPLSDTRALLWSSLKFFGFAPCSDLMDYIEDDLAVELYDSDGRQLFRNFKFMEVCSYTLADVLMYPWWELFYRVDEVAGRVHDEIAFVLSGTVSATVPSQIPSHRTGEIFSERRHELDMRFHCFSPVFSRLTKRPAGFVCTSEVRVVSVSANKGTSPRPNLRMVDSTEISG